MYQMHLFFFTIKPNGRGLVLVQAKNAISDVTESNKLAERRSVFVRLFENESGAVEDCLKEYGDFVWAFAKRYADSPESAEKMTEEIFADIWKFAAAFGINICDEKEVVALIARRYLLMKRREEQLNRNLY